MVINFILRLFDPNNVEISIISELHVAVTADKWTQLNAPKRLLILALLSTTSVQVSVQVFNGF